MVELDRTDAPHGRHLRKGRHSESGRIYLITAVTAGRAPVFGEFRLARAVVAVLRDLDGMSWTQTLAWVVMPDHLHWLLALGETYSLAACVRAAKGRSARAVNLLRGTDAGPLWQKGYYDHALRRDEDLRGAARYVVANPLRAGLVRNIGDYPHWDAAWL